MSRLLSGRRLNPPAELVLFDPLANRALDPTSKPADAHWVTHTATSTGSPTSATTPATARWIG